MSQKIYVGNLNYATTGEGLKDLFGNYGEVVSAIVIKDRLTHRSKGFGFVEMEDEAAVKKAIEELNETDFEGRKIRVNYAEERQQPPQH
ncbi:RNA-binding protein [Treponema phagedenis]|uniref:RNA-binding protein n=1 Tax=Treponema phagedenis TaxID=162 RepID=A0A0B7GZV0_TREPH|nr:RNA-binding protein [Treponema phagedenis]EFW38254.1 hypothetical protein HMPREF9554_01227 [Treponema phagedenis F0421]NVP23699.1 RNA-binding protein [Treponema phagedenis]QEJ94476.1 RNA-binding protein [Treponema phagedenis]QEJ97543.1 RNA-binding protein [Treponema phagedenis]QEK01642.1 RNA-binding protein [Treponema phagedenis]